MRFGSFINLLFCTALVTGLKFDSSLKSEYTVGEILEVSVTNDFDQENWMVGIPAISLSLYDEAKTMELFKIMEMIQLKKFPNYGGSMVVGKWEIPLEIQTKYKTGERFSLVLNYKQSKRGIAKPLDLSIDHPIIIHGIHGTGVEAIPPVTQKVGNSVTWVYNMITSLLMNSLL